MPHKKRKTVSNSEIESTLLSLPFPIQNNIGMSITIKKSNSSRSTSKHISKQYHGLTKHDILMIPSILKSPLYVIKDPNHKEKKNYYGRRSRTKKILFIKIVTKIIDVKNEEIITVFTTNHIKR